MQQRLALVPVVLLAAACGESNPPELNEAAQKAAETYCTCVKDAGGKTAAELAKEAPCQQESKAFNTAWEALPVRARDPKAGPIYDYYNSCSSILSTLRGAAMSDGK